MSGLQKTIKYLAIAFAIYLVFNIITGIMYGVSFIGHIFQNDDKVISEKFDSIKINENTLLLDINVASSSIIIKNGDTFKAETNNKYIESKQDKNKLYIKERKHNLFNYDKNSELIIYIPNDFIFDGINLETGAGKVNIESLSSKILYLDLGAGKVTINNLNVLEEAEIDGGAGEITITDSDIHNLDLEMGIGKLSLTSKLTGNSKIDSGIGKIDLFLLGTIDDYSITLDKGLGNATIDGDDMVNNKEYGNGFHRIDIDGGIGSIDIDFIN